MQLLTPGLWIQNLGPFQQVEEEEDENKDSVLYRNLSSSSFSFFRGTKRRILLGSTPFLAYGISYEFGTFIGCLCFICYNYCSKLNGVKPAM